ncbi:type IV secretory system conjugative DNA transfer family protein [Flagellimonas pacifica]|uniref:Type IV secretory pathway, VirD4 component, TraG/TraD family ATPase n=1 Tax=Flagellimonas pacifica TaxID=1247520 RepID=A0A285MQV0_9FLAO|nr:type IV secretion system DNA-binding domain-containing protein [Allomuricauda parva]SNY99545.1 Type IV secretory pathway, VirD4 component, TraG/TraD family ATPase [Allomuricauda parva]
MILLSTLPFDLPDLRGQGWAYPLLFLSIVVLHFRFCYTFGLLALLFLAIWGHLAVRFPWHLSSHILLWAVLPAQFLNGLGLLLVATYGEREGVDAKYRARLRHRNGMLTLRNIRRGVSIIGSAGSGKTESVVRALLKHFHRHGFAGVIHDYKHFEITELAWPLFQKEGLPLHIVSFDTIYKRVNPIAPRYLPDEESVNEVARVLIENLLEQRDSQAQGSTKFFNDAVEGLLGGMIWMLRTHYERCCTLPHLIAVYQFLSPKRLIQWLSTDLTAKAMADAFIAGKESERQTAGVLSTLANALKKISTQRIFMALSADELDLDINNPDHPSVVAIVNHPKYDIAYSPIIATLLHTITKQMAVRGRHHSFMLVEEAPTIRLLNMHRIPATLRSYDISTVYVMQDKNQNDMMYGDKASRAILANLSYQFFGKVNDPGTAMYFEAFFEMVKKPIQSVSKGVDPFRSDTRITKSEKEVSKVSSDAFFRLKQGEFFAFSDGKSRRIRFPVPRPERGLPQPKYAPDDPEIARNFERIHKEAQALFKSGQS